MIVVLSGHDGSGKTYTATLLDQIFKKKGLKTKHVSFKGYFFVDWFIKLLRAGYFDNSHKRTYKELKTTNPIYYLWPYIVFVLDYIYYLCVIIPCSYNHIIIVDRFFIDRIVGFYYFGYLSSFGYRMLLWLSPKTKHSFILQCNAELALERETDEKHKISFYQEMHNLYLEIGVRYNHVMVDSSNDIKLIITEILESLHNGYHK